MRPVSLRLSSRAREVIAVGRDRGIERVWLLNLLLIAAVVAVWFGADAIDAPPTLAPTVIPWWGLSAFFFAVEWWPLSIAVRRGRPSLPMTGAPFALGLFFTSPRGLMAGFLLGEGAVALARVSLNPRRLILRAAVFLLGAGLGLLVFRGFGGSDGGPRWGTWAVTYAATVPLIFVSNLVIPVALWLRLGSLPGSLVRSVVLTETGGPLLSVSIGLAGVVLLWNDPHGIVLVGVLAAAMVIGYAAALSERQRRETAEFLHGVGDALQRGPELEGALTSLLLRTTEMFGARVARLTVHPIATREQAYRTTVVDGAPCQAMVPLSSVATRGELDDDTAGTIITRDTAEGPVRDLLSTYGATDAMVAALVSDGSSLGTILVAGHSGAGDRFEARDLALLQSLAEQTASILRHGQIEPAVARITDLERRLTHQQAHDDLTGLLNRTGFAHEAERRLLAGPRRPFAVLLFDIDDFKAVNETLGHAAGDELLRGVADRLRGCMRPSDLPARVGGDEFAVLVEDVDDPEEAELLAALIIAALRTPIVAAGQAIQVRLSVGFAVTTDGPPHVGELLRQADVAMYAAKASGKDRVVAFAAGLETAVIDRHHVRVALETALDHVQLTLHYQPIVDLATGSIEATEALVRWHHPDRGIVGPDSFVGVAEETGLVQRLGAWVLHEACRQTVAWRHRVDRDLAVSVNVSARQLQQPLFVEDVLATVRGTGIPTTAIILELTETTILDDGPASIAKLEALQRLGIRIAIDDFGTGYSSLSYLRRLPVDIIKIAKPFVDDVGTKADADSSFARAIIGLGTSLGLPMVAEGIEQSVQVEVLRDLGCTLGQGYHLSEPRTAEEILPLLIAGAVDLGPTDGGQIVPLRRPSQ